jgi:flavin reductase (DIM6/NTAB) family NADH-FMN oxidoreductase RutF
MSPLVDARRGCGARMGRLRASAGILARMRTDFDPGALSREDFYRLLTAVVVPRPIAWVSSTTPDGTDNLAPHSFFTIACAAPPIVQFSSVGRKDSLRNIEDTREFVVNFAPEALMEKINATATDFPRGTSEFDAVGVQREPSLRVKPPRVAGSPVALECALHSTVRLGDSTVVFGRVVHASVAEEVIVDGHPEAGRMRPLARMGRNEWSSLGEIREIERIPYGAWQQREGREREAQAQSNLG